MLVNKLYFATLLFFACYFTVDFAEIIIKENFKTLMLGCFL